ncbi:MAG: SH3 domain-containing protein [Candidatus Omnitrophota bacterium]
MFKHKILFTFIISALILFSAAFAFSAEPDPKTLFLEANIYYEKGDYNKAIELYEGIINEGYKSGALYYNLGGAYFKNNKLGLAILNYERAEKIMPRDADLNANYKFAESKITGNKILPAKSFWNWKPLKTYAGSFNANEFTSFASGTYLLIIMLAVIAIVRPEIKRNIFIIAGILSIFVLLNAAILYHEITSTRAVTVVSKAEVLFGPFDSGTKFFTLQEGMVSVITKEKDDWYKVRCEDGKVGWVKKSALEKV